MTIQAVAPEAQIGDVIQWPLRGTKIEKLAEVRAINTDQGVRKLVTTQGTIAADTEGLVIVQRRGESPAALAPADEDRSPLTPREEYDFKRCEAVIATGLRTFYQVGSALQTIRERRLYRQTHATFDAYCRERWQMTKTSANRNIAAAEIADRLAPVGVTPEDVTERQIRPLAKLPDEQQPEAWQRAQELAAGAAVTSAHVEQAVIEFQEPERPDYRGFDVFQRVKWVEHHPQGRGKPPLEITRYGKVDALYNGSLIVKLPEGGIVSLMPDRPEGIWRTEAVGVCAKCHAETEQFYAPMLRGISPHLCLKCGDAAERAVETEREADAQRQTAEAEMRAEQTRLRDQRLARLFARASALVDDVPVWKQEALLAFDSLCQRAHPAALAAVGIELPDFWAGSDFATERDALEELTHLPRPKLRALAVLNALADNEERLEWYLEGTGDATVPSGPAIVDAAPSGSTTAAVSEAVPELPFLAPRTLEYGLLGALCSFEGGRKRWITRRRRGLTDEELVEAIGSEFGDGGHYGDDGHWDAHGGPDPRFWWETSRQGKPTLRGKALTAAVRELLQIPQPAPDAPPISPNGYMDPGPNCPWRKGMKLHILSGPTPVWYEPVYDVTITAVWPENRVVVEYACGKDGKRDHWLDLDETRVEIVYDPAAAVADDDEATRCTCGAEIPAAVTDWASALIAHWPSRTARFRHEESGCILWRDNTVHCPRCAPDKPHCAGCGLIFEDALTGKGVPIGRDRLLCGSCNLRPNKTPRNWATGEWWEDERQEPAHA